MLNVTFAVTDQNGASPALICWNNSLTLGGPDTLFNCLGGAVTILANERIRLRVEYISGQPIDLSYDGGVLEDSSITVPVSVPEFGDIVAPVAGTGVLVLFLSHRRRRRTT